MRPSVPARLLVGLLLVGCAGEEEGGSSGEVSDYTVNLQPAVPLNQTGLIQELDSLELVITPEVGESVTVPLEGSLEKGDYAQAIGLPALDQATLSLLGKRGGTLTAFGRSAPVDASTGEIDVTLMLSEFDRPGLLGGLPEARWKGAAVALGDGRFAVVGGSSRNGGSAATGSNSVQVFDISNPESDLSLVTSELEVPDLNDDFAGRAGLTATPLTAQHDDQGKILIAGGSADALNGTEVSRFLWVWDPLTGEAEKIEGNGARMGAGMSHHTAVEDAAGNVVLAGGMGENDEPDSYRFENYVAVYDAASRELVAEYFIEEERLTGTLTYHSAARLGSDGTLICGGLEVGPDSDGDGYSDFFAPSAQCFLVNLAGDLEEVDDLPIPLMLHQMITLDNGDVLALGGITGEEGVNLYGSTMPTSNAVFRFDGRDWTSVADADAMLNERAAFATSLLPDGRVLVVGGVHEGKSSEILFPYRGAIACAEIYDPESGQSVAVDGCTENTDSASLPTRTAYPMMVSDPDYGVFIAGGVGVDGEVLDQALFFMPRGIED